MQLQNPSVKRTSEAMSFRHLPFSVNNCKCNVFVWLSCVESYRQCVVGAVRLKEELGGLSLVNQIRVEDVEFVTLDHLRWWVFRIVVRLVVFVPLKALFHTVEESGLPLYEKCIKVII